MEKTLLNKIILMVVVAGIGFVVYQSFFKKQEPVYSTFEAVISSISEEVSETGTVKKGEEINLGFKTSGRIEKIYVEVGDRVQANASLAKLETTELVIQLSEAKAALDLARAKLNQLLAGSSAEEIKIAETTVTNAQSAVEDAEQRMKDIKAVAEENLKQDYEDALNALDGSYLKIYNAYNTADLIQRTYFTLNDQESIKVRENKDIIEGAMASVKSQNEKVDTALLETRNSLEAIYEALSNIREICEKPLYRDTISSTDKTSLDTQESCINTVLTDIINCEQAISSTKLANESNINAAKANLSTVQGTLEKAEAQLALKKAGPRPADIDLREAQVKQAQANVSLLKNQIRDCTLKSPVQGQITRISQKAGEMAKNTVISLIPSQPFQIEVDIPETDIGKISLGNPTKITLDAFPEKNFAGKVIEIEPAETIIQGVVYYKTKISMEERESGIKPGMTASIVITTASKENVLIIPQRAVIEKEGKKIVKILENKKIKEKEVKTGLRGSKGMIEIISGLTEGERIITFVKND